jgi:putative glycosyltransferase (TIGR04372 family)
MKSLDRHITEIRSGGWPAIYLKLFSMLRVVEMMLHAFWAVPTVVLVRILRPLRIIRFGSISSSRIGSFVNEAGYKWAMSTRQSKKYLDFYWLNPPICNLFWARMVKRNFHVHYVIRFLDRWNQILPGGTLHYIPTNATKSTPCDVDGWLEQTPEKMPFLPEEDAKAKAWLKNLGWQEGERFVCLLVRDSSYLDKTCPNTTPLFEDTMHYDPKTGYGWNHLDYRDSDIATYVPAAEWLAEQGVWVIRMGKIMAKPIPSRHHRIIDYAFREDKSDFLDIWLFAHCDLCISTGTGPDEVSDIYRRPILFVNFLPLHRLTSWSGVMHVPKNLIWQETAIPLNCQEYLRCNFYYYNRLGIRILDLTAKEILESVQEQWQRLNGTWVDTEDDIRRQRRFWELLKMLPDYHKRHGWIHPEARIGTTWLRAKGDTFLE